MEQVNSTLEQNYNDYDTYLCDFMLLMVNILGLSANFVIIFIIRKCKLWKMSTYFCILNWTILDILRLLTSPGIFRWYEKIHDIFHDYVSFSTYVCCSFAFQLGTLLLLFILVLQAKVKFFGKNYIGLIWIVWGLVFILLLLSILGTIRTLHGLHVSGMFSAATYVILIIVLFTVCVAFFAKQSLSENDFRLILSLVSTYVFVWLFVILILAVSIVVMFTLQSVFNEHSVIFAFALAESCPLINLYILQKIDRRFQLCGSCAFFSSRKKEESTISFANEDKNEVI